MLVKFDLNNNVPFKHWLHDHLDWTPDQDELEVYTADCGYVVRCPGGDVEYVGYGGCGKPFAVYLNKDSNRDAERGYDHINAGFYGYVPTLDNRAIFNWVFTKEHVLEELKNRGVLVDTVEQRVEALRYFSEAVQASANSFSSDFLPTIRNLADCMIEKYSPPVVTWLN